ncbi:MAG: acetyl-CoA carboxylase biotin carboxylase subunit [Actinobacteria bacterium]|nr:acetyl-CoA carboxylase biotin carboxylase subunit [Actinomycetota bacterium]MCL6105138.1 acetyl-CoA carboxylase biotin carboxylase subunit [Actinomycetota bacterium]
MFNKILIANRGEIAVRTIRTCKDMGIETVAVYSELDVNAQHVQLADEAYALGGKTAATSYLNTQSILEILKKSKAQALHPGYGFFSENASFAADIEKAGVTFIGPPPKAIQIMGDKVSSRHAAREAGVQGVPGTEKTINTEQEIVEFGNQFGWPVAIKAAFGGGGKGMRIVAEPQEAQEALDSARREADAYFGNADVYLERYLTAPRHIEIQVIADTHGNKFWLGERDCSCQRRHQKLVEESPAGRLSDETRHAMGDAALKIVQACGYYNAGTVEFLYDQGQFYFLEMNTRLQVEHPVTELVTGLDLVELQIRIAAGERLDLDQNAIRGKGHAIECRINAEDPTDGQFLPSPGTITTLRLPSGPGVRVDSGYEQGDTISQFYDNLLAKVVTWGPDRETARKRMLRALSEMQVKGVFTNIPAQVAILSHADFIQSNHWTTWVEQKLDLSSKNINTQPVVKTDNTAEQLSTQEVVAEVNGRRFNVKLWLDEAQSASETAGKTLRSITAKATTSSVSSKRTRPRHKENPTPQGIPGAISIPMQGTIVKIMVEADDEVEAGQTICVLEAMKMENMITTDRAGKISEIRVSAGDTVGPGDIVAIVN